MRPATRGLRLARRLVAGLLPPRDREFILGDLDELHAKWLREEPRQVATRRYLRAMIASVFAQRGPRPSGPRGGRPPGGRPGGLLRELAADCRTAARLLRQRPGFVALVAMTLGLGVGAAGAVFAMANQLLLRPPPGVNNYRNTAVLEFRTNERDYVGISAPDMVALRDAATLLDGFASTDELPSAPYVSAGASRPVAINGLTVYGDYFALLGVRPLVGRLLSADETGPGAEPLVAVISETLWETLFARSPDVVGRQIEMSGQRLTVVGVADGGFRGASASWPVDVWAPAPAIASLESYPPEYVWSRDSTLNQNFVVRLRPGSSFAAAEEQLDAIIDRLADADPEHREFLSELHAGLSPGLRSPRPRDRLLSTLRAFAGAAALVVLIACANGANLLFVRALQTRNEIAVRRALGASSARVARQQLVEAALLAAAGTAVGLLVTWAIGLAFLDGGFSALAGFRGLDPDRRFVGFSVGAIAATTILFGAVPAALAGRFDLNAALRGAGRTSTRRESAVRQAMSALQIALSLTLLVGGILLVRTVRNLYATDAGIATEDVSILTIRFGAARPDDDGFAVLYRQLPEVVGAVPGVQRAAVDGWYGPFIGRPSFRIATLDAPEDAVDRADMRRVTPGWFEVLGVRPLAGRTFVSADARPAAPPVVLLTARLAQRLFGRIDVVGQSVRVELRPRTLEEAEIIGVVGDVRLADLRSEPDEAVFLPLIDQNMGPVALIARFSGGGETQEAIRKAVESVIPSIAVPQPTTLRGRIDDQLAEQRVFMRLLGLLSMVGVLLAAVGLYGVVAFAVSGRRREFGIRLAMGAEGPHIAGLVARSAAKIVASGTALGLAGAYALSGMIESLLYGVEAVDAASYLAAAGLLAVVAAAACWLPARAAMAVQPSETLRES